MAQVVEAAAFDSAESFALRVKYEKHVLFIPVEPSTSYDVVVSRALGVLAKSDTRPPQQSGFSSFNDMEAEDAALFSGSTSVVGGSAAYDSSMRFMQMDRSKQSTVSKMGFKDGPEAVAYLGFRSKETDAYDQPVVTLPSLVEDDDDEEEEDPDAIPPPLDDQDAAMVESGGKGKARA